MNMEIDQGQSSAWTLLNSDRDIVFELLGRSFGSQSQSEQKDIARMSRPMPKLLIKMRDRSFQESWYPRRDWLCGSVHLFCWPCLLFRSSKSAGHAFYFVQVSLQLGHFQGMC